MLSGCVNASVFSFSCLARKKKQARERRREPLEEGKECLICFKVMRPADSRDACDLLTFCVVCGQNLHRDCVARSSAPLRGSARSVARLRVSPRGFWPRGRPCRRRRRLRHPRSATSANRAAAAT